MDIDSINAAADAGMTTPVASPGASASSGVPATTPAAPPLRFHVTRPGGPVGLDPKGQPKEASRDTLVSLAQEYGVPWQDIAMATFESTDPVTIANLLRDENFGVSVEGHWLMAPGLQVKIPTVGADGKPYGSGGFKIPTWAKVAAGVGVLGAAAWMFAKLVSGGSGKDDPDDDEPDEDEEE